MYMAFLSNYLSFLPFFSKKNLLNASEMPHICPVGTIAFLGARGDGSFSEPRNTLTPRPESSARTRGSEVNSQYARQGKALWQSQYLADSCIKSPDFKL